MGAAALTGTTTQKAWPQPGGVGAATSKGRSALKERSAEDQERSERGSEHAARVSCSARRGSGAAVNRPDWPRTLAPTDAELRDPEIGEQKRLPPTRPGRPPRHGSERHGGTPRPSSLRQHTWHLYLTNTTRPSHSDETNKQKSVRVKCRTPFQRCCCPQRLSAAGGARTRVCGSRSPACSPDDSHPHSGSASECTRMPLRRDPVVKPL